MLSTSARLLRLLTMLQGRRDWPGAELAERLEVDVRTLRRDVDRLRDLGYQIGASSGPGGGYQFGAGRQMPPLLLDDDEALAVAVALRAAAPSVARLEETALRVLVKLEQLLPRRLHARLSALQAMTVSLAAGDGALDPRRLTELAAACRDHERVDFDYADHRGRASSRHVEPHRLAHTGRRWYLVGWDTDRDDWRTFRVDRIGPLARGARFVARTFEGDLAAYVARSISVAAYDVRARVRIAAPVAELAAKLPPWIGVLEPEGAATILSIGAPTLPMIAAHLALLDLDFEILDPPELAPHLRALGARFTRAARSRGR